MVKIIEDISRRWHRHNAMLGKPPTPRRGDLYQENGWGPTSWGIAAARYDGRLDGTVSADSVDQRTMFNRALTEWKRTNPKKAENYFQRAAVGNSELSKEASFSYAQFLWAQDRKEEAQTLLTQLTLSYPAWKPPFVSLSNICLENGDLNLAETWVLRNASLVGLIKDRVDTALTFKYIEARRARGEPVITV